VLSRLLDSASWT